MSWRTEAQASGTRLVSGLIFAEGRDSNVYASGLAASP